MRANAPFAHTDTPFLSATPGGAWVATRYAECYRILQDWEHFSSNPTPEASEQLAGDLVITLDPPRQQKFRKVLNPYFSPARMKALRTADSDETDRLIDAFIELGTGDLAQVAWRQPGIVFFKYLLGIADRRRPAVHRVDRHRAQRRDRGSPDGVRGAGCTSTSTTRCPREPTQPPQDDMIDVLLKAEIDGEKLPFQRRRRQRHAAGAGRPRDDRERDVVRIPLPRNTSRRTRPAHRRTRDHATSRRGVHPLRRIDSRHSANRRQGRRAQRTHLLPRRVGIVNYASANRDPHEFPEPDRCILDRTREPTPRIRRGSASLPRLQPRPPGVHGRLEQVLSRIPDYALAPERRSGVPRQLRHARIPSDSRRVQPWRTSRHAA